MRNMLTRLVRRDNGSQPGTGEKPSKVGAWLGRPMTSFHLVVAVVALLTSLGLIMVLSASGVRSYDDDGSPCIIFGRQVIGAIGGLIRFYLALRVQVRLMRHTASFTFALTIVMLVLVLVP